MRTMKPECEPDGLSRQKMACAASLGEACAQCGGVTPDLTMTLAEFIDTFGPNYVQFRYVRES